VVLFKLDSLAGRRAVGCVCNVSALSAGAERWGASRLLSVWEDFQAGRVRLWIPGDGIAGVKGWCEGKRLLRPL
jgi:hypothetical protein